MYHLILSSRSRPDQMMDLNKKQITNSGLTNQLFSLVNGVLRNNVYNRTKRGEVNVGNFKSIFIIDAFNTCIESGIFCEVGKIINLEETGKNFSFILNKKILLLDRHNLPKFRIINGSYGLPQLSKRVNLSEGQINLLNNIINPSYIKINNEFIGSDPAPGIKKMLFLIVEIFEENFFISFEEGEIFFLGSFFNNFLNIFYDFAFYDEIDETLFNKLLNGIVFSSKFNEIISILEESNNILSAQSSINNISSSAQSSVNNISSSAQSSVNNISSSAQKIIFVHFRLEDDAIEHWSRQNKMTRYDFFSKMIYQYGLALEKNVNCEEDIIYILSYEQERVMQQFPQYKYIRHITKENKNKLLQEKFGLAGRELSAIIDLILARKLCKTFIGCHNLQLKRGSTFSYSIIQNISPGNKICLIDLDQIDSPLVNLIS